MYLVSACLLGFRTRYDGTAANLTPETEAKVRRLLLEGRAVPICPEQIAGLPTPRPMIEFRGGDGVAVLSGNARAVSATGEDCTAVLRKGAEEVLRIARLYDIRAAIFKDGSPSCGVSYVYIEGKASGGQGVTTAVLIRAGLEVKTVDSI